MRAGKIEERGVCARKCGGLHGRQGAVRGGDARKRGGDLRNPGARGDRQRGEMQSYPYIEEDIYGLGLGFSLYYGLISHILKD